MVDAEKTIAPEGSKCEAPGCGAVVGELRVKSGVVHCAHHASWPDSDEGKKFAAHKQIDRGA